MSDERQHLEAHGIILAAESEVTVNMTDEEAEPKVMESLLLSVAHFWSIRETAGRQVDLMERHFRQDEMLAALRQLSDLVGLPAPKQRNPGATRTATKAQAEDVVAIIKQLGDGDKLPRFNVQSDDLPRVLPLLGAVSVGDEQGVSSRLEALEITQKKNMEEMKRMVATIARSVTQPAAAPEIIVNGPASFADVARTGQADQTGQAVAGQPPGRRGSVITSHQALASSESRDQFYLRQGRMYGGSSQAQNGSRHRNERSQSAKRRRAGEGEDEWREAPPPWKEASSQGQGRYWDS